MTLRIAILVFDSVEVLDFAGPYEVFTTASRVHSRNQPAAAPAFSVTCVSKTGTPVTARAGLKVLPEHSFASCPACDVLVVPGGVVDAAMRCKPTLQWIAAQAAHAGLTASICTGVFLLAGSGVVKNETVTTHWEDIGDLRQQFPALDVREGVRWVDSGRLVTSAGISAGIDMSLHLVGRLKGIELAQKTARQMDYAWAMNGL